MSDKLGKPLSGQVINVTCKMAPDHQRLFDSMNIMPVENKDSPACLRGDLLLSSNPVFTGTSREPTNAQGPVFNLDTLNLFEEETKTLRIVLDDPNPEKRVCVVQSYAQYLMDVFDARTHSELYLATHQICFVVVQPGQNFTQSFGVYSPDHRLYDGTAKTYQMSKEQQPVRYSLRQNIVVCVPDTMLLRYQDEYDKREHQQQNLNTILVPYSTTDFWKWESEARAFKPSDLNGEQWAEIKQKLKPPQVRVSLQTEQLVAPRMPVYMGIALTDAFFSSAYGDDRVTTNRYSLLSLRNGPLHVVNEDKLHWIFRCEQHNYRSDGCRFSRPDWSVNPRDYFAESYNSQYIDALNINLRFRRNDKTGSDVAPKFLIIPLKSLSTSAGYHSTGYLDETNCGRTVGIAKQNGEPGHNIDVINIGRGVN